MKAKIQEKYKKNFNPTFGTVIFGKIVRVSLSQAENEAEKFATTAMGYMYEGHEKLKKEVLKRQGKPKLEVLDMNKAERGTVFDKNSSPRAKAIAMFESNQTKGRERMARRKDKKLVAVKKTPKKKPTKKRVSKKK